MSSFRIEKKKKEKEEESRGKSKARIGGNEDKKNTEKNPHIGGGGVNERREKIYSTGGRRTQAANWALVVVCGFLSSLIHLLVLRFFAICNLLLVLQSLPPPSHLRDGSACPGSRTSTSGHLSGSTGPASQSPGKPRARQRPPLSSSSDAGHTNTDTQNSLSIKKKNGIVKLEKRENSSLVMGKGVEC